MSKKPIKLGAGLALPLDAITEAIGIVGQRGTGKTHTSGVCVEQMLKSEQQVVILDPLDSWWGLRSSADGKRDGLAVTVLGGDHGDLPITENDGRTIADLVVQSEASIIICVEHLSKEGQRKFAHDFFRRLYRKNKEAMHLVVDEADIFAPQKTRKGEGAEKCKDALDDIVRRGRKKGIGVTLITQRPAVIDKDVLSQVSMLIVHRLTGPQDQDQIWEWVKRNGDTDLGKQMMEKLPKMRIGRCWVYSPGWLNLFGQYDINKKTTFDSSATPTPGQRRVKPKRMAKVELEAVRESLASTIRAADNADPVLLHQKIRKLEGEKRSLELRVERAVGEVQVEQVYALSEEQSSNVQSYLKEIGEGLVRDAKNTSDAIQARIMSIVQPEIVSRHAVKVHEQPAPKRAAKPPERRPMIGSKEANHPIAGVTPVMQRLLNALEWLRSIRLLTASRVQVALLANISPKSSALGNHLGKLRTMGLIDYPSTKMLTLTVGGIAAAEKLDVLPTAQDLHNRLERSLPPVQWRLLKAVIDSYPSPLLRAEAAEEAGIKPTSSALGNHLGSLRALGLIDYPGTGEVVGTPALFLEN